MQARPFCPLPTSPTARRARRGAEVGCRSFCRSFWADSASFGPLFPRLGPTQTLPRNFTAHPPHTPFPGPTPAIFCLFSLVDEASPETCRAPRAGHAGVVTEKTGRRARGCLGCRNTPQGGRCDGTPNIGEKQARQDDLLPDKVWSPYAAGDAAGWSVRCVRASPALLFQQGEKGWSGRPTWA